MTRAKAIRRPVASARVQRERDGDRRSPDPGQRLLRGMQRHAGNRAVAELLQRHGTGDALPSSERRFFEERLGHDFSRVRLHHDDRAAGSAHELSARAYTVGSDIVFGRGQYEPGTEPGRELLAHELVHVVQQRRGGPPAGAEGSPSERGAESVASSVAAGQAVSGVPGGTAVGVAAQTMDPRHARGFVGEQGAGFEHYSTKQGWFFVEGPSGAAGHGVTTSGFDGVAYNPKLDQLHLVDNKSLKATGNVQSATAIDPSRNLMENLDGLIKRVEAARDMPSRIRILQLLRQARGALAAGAKLPAQVRLVVTGVGGRSTGVSGRLARLGVIFMPRQGAPAAAQAAAKTTGKPPAKTSAKTRVKTTAKAPVKTTAKAPVKTTAKAPVKTTAKAPVKTTAKAPVKATAKVPAKTTAKAPVKTTVKTPAATTKAPAAKTAIKAPAAPTVEPPATQAPATTTKAPAPTVVPREPPATATPTSKAPTTTVTVPPAAPKVPSGAPVPEPTQVPSAPTAPKSVPSRPATAPAVETARPPLPTGSPFKAGLKAGAMAAGTVLLFMGLQYLVRKELEEQLDKNLEMARKSERRLAEQYMKPQHPDMPVYFIIEVRSEDYSRYIPLVGWMPETPKLGIWRVELAWAPLPAPILKVKDDRLKLLRPGMSTSYTWSELAVE